MLQLKSDTGSDVLIGLPDNEEIGRVSENGESFFNLSEENEIVQQIDDFLLKLN
jgi:hypothetical protein